MARPRDPHYGALTPKGAPGTQREALALISHINPQDRQALTEAFDEGFRSGGMKTGLQFIQDTATQWREDKEYVPSEE